MTDSPAREIHRTVTDKSVCDFYHVVELPDGSLSQGQWDLRKRADRYLGGMNFLGQTVIEIGPASGFLSFHMERRGARVTCVEPPAEQFWDLVPRHGFDLENHKRKFWTHIERVRNSFWYLHGAYRSGVRCFEADAYGLPDSLGSFDIGVLSSILLHCSSPVRLIDSVARRVSGSLIIADTYQPDIDGKPVCRLLPSGRNDIVDTWWSFSSLFFTQYLAVIGFPTTRVTRHRQFFVPTRSWIEMFTIVGSRAT